jgi:hypothetical protein
MMKELLQEIVALLIKHGVNVELDSAQIEICGAEIVFRCRDLSKMDWQAKQFQDMLDSMRIFNYRKEIYGTEDKV